MNMATGQQLAALALTRVDAKKDKIVYLKAGQGNTVTAAWLKSYRAKYGDAPYVGAEADIGKQAFDCSGLVTWCLKKLKANADNASHNPSQYQSMGIKITKDQIRPGDLCFKCTNSVAHHVGICVGNNQVVEAKGRKWGVIKSSGAASWDIFRRVKRLSFDEAPAPPDPPEQPEPTPGPGDNEPPEIYTVVKGDSLSRIAARYDLKWPTIALLNGIKSPYIIHVGQKLRLYPAPTYYIVKKGDCLSAIGKALGKDWHCIARDNDIVSPYVIRVRQKLRII